MFYNRHSHILRGSGLCTSKYKIGWIKLFTKWTHFPVKKVFIWVDRWPFLCLRLGRCPSTWPSSWTGTDGLLTLTTWSVKMVTHRVSTNWQRWVCWHSDWLRSSEVICDDLSVCAFLCRLCAGANIWTSQRWRCTPLALRTSNALRRRWTVWWTWPGRNLRGCWRNGEIFTLQCLSLDVLIKTHAQSQFKSLYVSFFSSSGFIFYSSRSSSLALLHPLPALLPQGKPGETWCLYPSVGRLKPASPGSPAGDRQSCVGHQKSQQVSGSHVSSSALYIIINSVCVCVCAFMHVMSD